MTDQDLRFRVGKNTELTGPAHPASAQVPQCRETSPTNVVQLAPYRLRRDAAESLALLSLELEEVQAEQRSLQLQHEIAEVNSEEWHQLVLSRADLQDYAWGLERSIERLREEVAK
jgi:hypothetical protein